MTSATRGYTAPSRLSATALSSLTRLPFRAKRDSQEDHLNAKSLRVIARALDPAICHVSNKVWSHFHTSMDSSLLLILRRTLTRGLPHFTSHTPLCHLSVQCFRKPATPLYEWVRYHTTEADILYRDGIRECSADTSTTCACLIRRASL